MVTAKMQHRQLRRRVPVVIKRGEEPRDLAHLLADLERRQAPEPEEDEEGASQPKGAEAEEDEEGASQPKGAEAEEDEEGASQPGGEGPIGGTKVLVATSSGASGADNPAGDSSPSGAECCERYCTEPRCYNRPGSSRDKHAYHIVDLDHAGSNIPIKCGNDHPDDSPAVDNDHPDDGPAVDNDHLDDSPAVDNDYLDDGPAVDNDHPDDGPAVDNDHLDDSPAVDNDLAVTQFGDISHALFVFDAYTLFKPTSPQPPLAGPFLFSGSRLKRCCRKQSAERDSRTHPDRSDVECRWYSFCPGVACVTGLSIYLYRRYKKTGEADGQPKLDEKPVGPGASVDSFSSANIIITPPTDASSLGSRGFPTDQQQLERMTALNDKQYAAYRNLVGEER
ncbi:hypothetical protein MGG_04333 [Pyricularia oryzae 70-15]|uniref:Uncharacterized protein n=1 Tax=Pyricularia oryzae (strain 70-15 / ATCC MYA-4617 / FGSC 8958) TaxID=242507 RepID=G4NGF0_PYRO7|nr:uncharacterized protein MGG_04333 [Pyricularia oryzae 70-15]EHA47107.1 hypothetical protein MGG_04333 [Pyricularia oryzae 70-15]